MLLTQTNSFLFGCFAKTSIYSFPFPRIGYPIKPTISTSQLHLSISEFDKDYSKYQNKDQDIEAKSQFGTKSYWDAMYDGMGDFSREEYSWYYGFEVIKPYLVKYVSQLEMGAKKSDLSILVPGCGNDPLILDLFNAGYTRLIGFDYSEGAIDRQRELLQYLPTGSDLDNVELRVEDARSLPEEWVNKFDVIIEKGALDAIYLSGNANFEISVKELERVLKDKGICISCSGVVPAELRKESFSNDTWEWLRDGTGDLKAGCFVLQKK
jgi:SAM-dependent methyltransferase